MSDLIDYKILGKNIKSEEDNSSSGSGAETLDARVSKHDAELLKHNKDLEKVNQLMFFGFIVLLVMVAGFVIAYFSDSKKAADQLQDERYELMQQKYDFLQERLCSIENISSSSAKISSLCDKLK